MKKNLFLFAVAALALTACTSEDEMVQTAAKQEAPKAVGFDVYTPAATSVTRAGQAGTMTTGRLQRSDGSNGGGFGVYAYLVEDAITAAGDAATTQATDYVTWQNRATPSKAPNFMVNEKVLWNNTNLGWYYTPLKYWPNETDFDSQTTPAEMIGSASTSHLDRLTFFAYAPYVSAGVDEPGITALTDKTGKLGGAGSVVEASVGYKASLDEPSASVDLLWGVAPAGGLSYTAVNGYTVSVDEGKPLIDMTKPDVNTSMKFLFQHALARIGINVVAAIDQLGAGGTLDPNTKITIDEVTLTGKFGETGVLNLDNPTANVAHWTKINNEDITSTTTSLTNDKILTLSADAGTIAPWLRYVGEHTFGSFSAQNPGVTTTKQDLITPRYYALDAIPAYSPSKQYYTAARATYTVTGSEGFYKLNGTAYEKVTSGTITDGTDPGYVIITEDGPHLGSGAQPYGSASNTKNFYTKSGDNYSLAGTGASISWGSASGNYYLLTTKDVEMSDIPFVYNNLAQATYTVTATDNIYSVSSGIYTKVPGTIDAPAIGTTTTSWYALEKIANSDLPSSTTTCPSGKEDTHYYTYDSEVFTHVGKGSDAIWNKSDGKTYWEVTPTALTATDIAFKYASGTYYDRERNYFMVVPTNNIKTLNAGLSTAQEEALRTIRVKIKYYVTTEDSKIDGGRTQIENVIEKDVLFPSLANGKSYMLNLVLGLTSVKMEAEVDDWKVINVNADLPQNTAE